MRTIILTVLVLVSLVVSSGSFAQERGKKDPCEKAKETGVTADLVECSLKKLADADAELNRTYRQLLSRLGDKKWEMKLRAAQQAWIKYRDTNCDYESEFNGGGSAVTFEYNFCLAEMTVGRTKELQKMLNKIKERDGD
ncbi:MAG TPA: lysozyme inhibitor LprI family protein [Blastocatellia bacterium]|nr:lysozyme inhibitor LprI family protein [Blastocatellia bacterium]